MQNIHVVYPGWKFDRVIRAALCLRDSRVAERYNVPRLISCGEITDHSAKTSLKADIEAQIEGVQKPLLIRLVTRLKGRMTRKQMRQLIAESRAAQVTILFFFGSERDSTLTRKFANCMRICINSIRRVANHSCHRRRERTRERMWQLGFV